MFCTNGVLLRMLTQGDGLADVTHIIVDEVGAWWGFPPCMHGSPKQAVLKAPWALPGMLSWEVGTASELAIAAFLLTGPAARKSSATMSQVRCRFLCAAVQVSNPAKAAAGRPAKIWLHDGTGQRSTGLFPHPRAP